MSMFLNKQHPFILGRYQLILSPSSPLPRLDTVNCRTVISMAYSRYRFQLLLFPSSPELWSRLCRKISNLNSQISKLQQLQTHLSPDDSPPYCPLPTFPSPPTHQCHQLTSHPRIAHGQRYPMPCWEWSSEEVEWEQGSSPKGPMSCGTQGGISIHPEGACFRP